MFAVLQFLSIGVVLSVPRVQASGPVSDRVGSQDLTSQSVGYLVCPSICPSVG